MKCIVHGSFSKHFEEIRKTCAILTKAGVQVLAPKAGDLIDNKDGFALFEDEEGLDPRYIELLYLHNLKLLGNEGFSYFVNPEGYIGRSASYELGIAQTTNVRCFFSHKLADHPAYIPKDSIISADLLADYIATNGKLPERQIKRNEHYIHRLWEELIVPGSIVAAGAIIEHQPRSQRKEKEVLLVKTHKWSNRYSIVGGKVRRNEMINAALLREVHEETGLNGAVGRHICTFDQLKNSGYYLEGTQHIFVDNVVEVKSKRVRLNEEAQDYIWALPDEALKSLDIEPNARQTLLAYQNLLRVQS